MIVIAISINISGIIAEETLRISGGRLERPQCISAVLGIAAAVVVTSSLSAADIVTSVVIIASLETRDTIVPGLQRGTGIESLRVVCLKRSAYLLRPVVIEKGASSSSSNNNSNGEGREWGGEMRRRITLWAENA